MIFGLFSAIFGTIGTEKQPNTTNWGAHEAFLFNLSGLFESTPELRLVGIEQQIRSARKRAYVAAM